MKKTEVSILLFHRVHPVRDVMWDPMDPIRFKSILKFIKKNYIVLPLLEILETKPVKGKKPLAAITFDDGYRDFIDYSLPIMDELKIPSSIYIVTDCICENKPTWTYEVDYLFFHTKKLQINWTSNMDFMPANLQKSKFVNKKELIAFCLKFKPHIKLIPAQKRKRLIQDLLSSFDDVSIPGDMMMNWNEINQLISSSIEVGSHTVTHPPLATLNKDDLYKELAGSRSEFFKYTGTNPKVISYPVGSYNQDVKETSALAGYKYGLAVNHKIYNLQSADNFEIPRIELYNEHFWKSWLRIKQYV